MRVLAGHKLAVRALAYSPEPRLFSAGDGPLRAWHPATGESAELVSSSGQVVTMRATADRLATGSRGGRVVVWPADRSGRAAFDLALPVVALEFTPDGRALWAAAGGVGPEVPGRLAVVNLEPSRAVEWLDWSGDLETAAFCPSRDLAAVAGFGRGVTFVGAGRARAGPAFQASGRVRAMAFSPSGRLAVASGRAVGVWDVDAGGWASRCEGHKGDVNAVAFSPDGRSLMTGGMDRSVRLFDAATGRPIAAWDWKVGVAHAIAYAPDGMTAAAAGDKGRVVVWDVDD